MCVLTLCVLYFILLYIVYVSQFSLTENLITLYNIILQLMANFSLGMHNALLCV